MNNEEQVIVVYTPRPELTIYRDTYLKCELVIKDENKQHRLKVISVHTGKGGLLADLTAQRADEIIMVGNKNVFYSLDEMHQALVNQL